MSEEGAGGNVEVYDQQEADFDDIVLRRSDPDDFEQIINLVEFDDIYNRFYSFPKILKLVETAYLSITVVNQEGSIIAFATFEDYPQGMKGTYDDVHYNHWEAWFNDAYQFSEFNAANTLWMTYFICSQNIRQEDQGKIFQKVLQTVYTSLPEILGILFLMKGDAEEEDINHCFRPLEDYFEEVPCKNRDVLKQVRGVHYNSKVWFSSRLLVLPFVKIRQAMQEDHDDLAAVFNSQSYTITEIYGDYFLAELIAAQDETNKALVAQVKDKAIGLMGFTSDVDVKLLHECFELEPYDNLFKPDYMDAINKRREHIISQRQMEEGEIRKEELKRVKEETMRCNIIAQRMSFQEYCLNKETEIKEKIDTLLKNEEEIKSLSRKDVEELFDEWFQDFTLPQPSEYFFDHPTNDSGLCTNIQTKQNFVLDCLEIFGLPAKYMDGAGHFPDWGKEKNDKSAQAIMRNMKMKKKKAGGNTKAMKKLMKAKAAKENKEKVKPTHFDLEPFLKAFKDFVAINSEVRSKIRQELKKEADVVDSIFVDEYGERSFKQCVDIMSLEKLLSNRNVNLHTYGDGTVGRMLRCFGQISYQLKEVIKMPDKDPKEVAKELNRKKAEEEAKAKEKDDKDPKKKRAPSIDEDSDELKKKAPPLPVNVKLYETSIHDMYEALEKTQDYDFTLESLGVVKGNLDDEKIKEGVKAKDEDESDINITNEDKDKSDYLAKRPPTRDFSDGVIRYSDDTEYNEIVKNLESLEAIPDPPEKAKNAFAITLFCIELAFDSRSRDFLQYAFDLYPDRDYLIVTQPHTVSETTLLQKFTCVEKKIQNTFPHVLYIIHRDSLLDIETCVRRAIPDDMEDIKALTSILDNKENIEEDIYNAVVNPESIYQAYVAKILNTVIGAFVISKDVNLSYYKSHFHIQDCILLPEHERRGHTRLVHSVINPIYERNTRYCIKEILRLSSKTCCYFEIANQTVIPQVFNELINVRSRRFPHFLKEKWDHERNVYEDAEEENRDDMDGADRDALDEEDAPFGLCFITRRLLSEPKIVKNSRIVVIGSSDTGISFIEALLSISYLRFTNIVMISPGGLPHHHFTDHRANLKAYSTSYTNEELKRLMLENRVKVINARMVDIDRKTKNVILHDDSIIPYDTLILAMGLQDQTLTAMNYSSKGIAQKLGDKKVVEGVLSVDDPFLYHYLSPTSDLIKMLCNRKKKNDVVVYGRTLNAYCCIQGLLYRGVKPENIFLIIPDPECHLDSNYDEEDEMYSDIPFINPEAFKDPKIRQKIHDGLTTMGVTIYEHCLLQKIEHDDNSRIKSVLFKRLDFPEEEEGEDDEDQYGDNSKGYMDGEGDEEDMFGEGEGTHFQKRKRKKNELPIDCKALITAGHRNVDPDVFNSIHNNGLVYNGRLIIDKNFQTTDPSIYAAGALCEFSGRYAAIAQIRSIRLDRYNGREMGSRLARSVFDIYDPAVSAASQEQSSMAEEELPSFFLPQGYGGKVPGNYWFYDTYTTNPLKLKHDTNDRNNRRDLMCDNIGTDGNGTLIKFTFNSIGLIDSVTYYGTEEIVVQSLWSFVGLHENYLNMLTSRFENGIIKNVVKFLSENWAMALYHEWFGDFCLRMRQGIQGMADIQEVLKKVFDETQNGEGITRDRMGQLRKMMNNDTVKMIEDETLEFIKVNLNHLPMYFIPGDEFEYGAK